MSSTPTESDGANIDSADNAVETDERSRPLVSLQNITVNFGGTRALIEESLDIYAGEIIGLLGHNGAGKSTLLNVATGALSPSGGSMEVSDSEVSLKGRPHELAGLGIKVIHQEPALVGNLRVWQNISLATANDRRSRRDRMELARQALAKVGAQSIGIRSLVSELSLGERQLVDIARAVATDLRVIFLDEPTAALGGTETANLHGLLADLAADGKGVVYVSHRLKDVLAVCTRLVILREGRIVFDKPNVGISVGDLTASLSAAKQVDQDHAPRATTASRSLEGSTKKHSNQLEVTLNGTQLSFSPGTVSGLFGMAADAQFALLESLYGLRKPVSATINGEEYRGTSPKEARKAGVHFVSGERERDSLIDGMSAVDNLTLPWLQSISGRLGVSRTKGLAEFAEAQARLSIRGAAPTALISEFSGGNRQKIVLARWMLLETPEILLLAQPTQGVDVAARVEIADAVREVAACGVTVLVASAEADEIDLLCDDAYVYRANSWVKVVRDRGNFEGALLATLLE